MTPVRNGLVMVERPPTAEKTLSRFALWVQIVIAILFAGAWLQLEFFTLPRLDAASAELQQDKQHRMEMQTVRDGEIKQNADILLQLEQERRILKAMQETKP